MSGKVNDLSKDAAKTVKEHGLDLVKEHITKAGTGAPTILEPVRYLKSKAIDQVKGAITSKIDEVK